MLKAKNMRNRKSYGIILIVLLAYLIRCGLWFQEPILSRDGVYYLLLAEEKRVTDYPMPHEKQAPLFSTILKKMYKIGIDPRKGGILMNIICSTALCWIVSTICHHLRFNRFWCLFCAFLTAIHPELVRNSHELQRESL